MEKDISLKIEIFTSKDDGRHRITSKKEIEFVLQNIAEKTSRVALYSGDTDDFILTTLLGVDSTGLWLEQSPSGPDNQRIATSSKLVFVSSHLQVKVQFTANHASSVVYQGYPAFYLPLPDSIYRLQRREYYRLAVPASEPLRCVIPVEKPAKKRTHEIIIMDISCGGVGLTCSESDIELVPGESYPNCRIDLPEAGTIIGTIVVRNLVILTSASGHEQKRAGCEFKDLDGQSIILLQRYVMNMQRAAKARTP
ncbi:MAG: flagellar brake protein [Nitrosomonadales bacterium]|nr:flagellar brake protein [Nitrosomonadales bacterium]